MSTRVRPLSRLRELSDRVRGRPPSGRSYKGDGVLGADERERVRRLMLECVEGHGGEASARDRAADLALSYLALSEAERRSFALLVVDEFAVTADVARRAAAQVVDASPDEIATAAQEARTALEAPWIRLLTQFNALADGPKFLVDLRADLLRFAAVSPELTPLERDLKALLANWFNVGALELRRITWDSPASLLETLAEREAVHAVSSWDDLKNRLDPDRRFFAFFHLRMPEEPLIFVQVALVSDLPAEIAPLLDPAAPLLDPDRADTAVFYSITSTQPGLAGISFGGSLIKQVVAELIAELPGLKRFATLSPIPGFRRWLEQLVETGEPPLQDGDRELLAPVLVASGSIAELELLERAKPQLLRLGAAYLLQAKRRDGGALDPVANFHLANGARIERVNWLADRSEHGMRTSLGLMVNYLYRLQKIESHHESYVGKATIAASSAVTKLEQEARR